MYEITFTHQGDCTPGVNFKLDVCPIDIHIGKIRLVRGSACVVDIDIENWELTLTGLVRLRLHVVRGGSPFPPTGFDDMTLLTAEVTFGLLVKALCGRVAMSVTTVAGFP